MGDRYHLDLNCAYCGRPNPDVYYAESSGSEEFNCHACGKRNRIQISFRSRKMQQPKSVQEERWRGAGPGGLSRSPQS
jgi:transposase-like protein